MYRMLVLAVLGLMACLLAGCPQEQANGEESGGMMMPPVAVIVEPAVMQDYASAITLVGEVRAAQRTVLTAEVSGAVTRIAHRVGEAHSALGGALIQIDPANYQVSLSGAQAQLTQAQERLRMAQAGPRAQEIAAQEAQVAAAKAQADQAKDNLERQRKLYEAGVSAETTLIAAQTAAEAAENVYKAQQEVLDQMLEGTRTEDIEAAKAAVQAAQSGVTAAEIALGKTSVITPFNAVVTALYVEVGQFVGPGTPLAEVVADGAVEAWFNLPEENIGNIEVGNAVELRCEAYGDEAFNGEIISISPQADMGTRQFPTRVRITDERLLPGMAVEGRLYLEDPKPVVMIPRDSVITSTLGEVIYVLDMASMAPPEGAPKPEEAPSGEPDAEGAEASGGDDMAAMMANLPTVKMVLVKTGDTVGRMAALLEGDVQPGMMVASRGNESLYEGAKVIPANLMGGGQQEGGPPAGQQSPAAADREQQQEPEAMEQPGDEAPGEREAPAEGAGK